MCLVAFVLDLEACERVHAANQGWLSLVLDLGQLTKGALHMEVCHHLPDALKGSTSERGLGGMGVG